jgi:diketogulonate reductase-like aldo/keto reductase
VLYHLGERGIERRLIPYCVERRIAVVGYSPFGSGDFPAEHSPGGRALAHVAKERGATVRQAALSFLVRLEGTFTIPKAADVEHARENAAAGALVLNDEEISRIDGAFPAPQSDTPLAAL